MPIYKTRRKPTFTFGVIEEEEKSPRSKRRARRQGKTIGTPKILKQTGPPPKSLLKDASLKALLPGKRLSKTGNVYWETRRNRSDAFRSRT